MVPILTVDMAIETINDIVEEIADKLEIYGVIDGSHESDCKCRLCFVSDLEDRLNEAFVIEQKLNT